MLDLSVVIPIYNTPTQDLQRCFDSLDALSPATYEVLLIDDGSEHPVGQFCLAYAAAHPCFRYIRKENGGVSIARNLGISHARGRYLTFVDADDRIMADILGARIPAEDGPDLVLFDILLTQQGVDSIWSAFPHAQGHLDRQQVLYQLCTASSISGPVAKLYKTALVQSANIQFNPQFISGEDWMFVCDYVMQAQSFVYYPQCAYRYFRENSTGQSRIARFPDKILHNQLARYQRKLDLIQHQPWTRYPAEQICSLAAVELIENLFNCAADLLLTKQYSTPRKQQIRTAIDQAGRQLIAPVPKKTRLKLQVITRFPIMLLPLALMRMFYLNRRK